VHNYEMNFVVLDRQRMQIEIKWLQFL